jgi:hypothetical protein
MVKKRSKKEDNNSIVTLAVTLAVVFIAALWIFSSMREPCPECEICEVCQAPECPVCETSVCPPPDCPQVSCPDCPVCDQCEECPEANGTRIVYKYVCDDTRIVDNANLCSVSADSVFEPVKTNEEGTLIEEVTVKPSCVYGKNGASVRFQIGSIAETINYQVKNDPDADWETVFSESYLFDGFRTISFRNVSDTYIKGDFGVPLGGVYLFRIEFKYGASGDIEHSNEHVIDTRPSSSYMATKCG